MLLLLAISNIAAIGSGKLHRGHWTATRGGGGGGERGSIRQLLSGRRSLSRSTLPRLPYVIHDTTITLRDTQFVQVCPLIAFHVRPPLLPAHYAPTVSPFCSLFHKVILLLLLIAMTLPHTQLPDSPRGSCSNVIDVTRTILSRAASTLSQGAKGKSSYTSTSIVAMSICSPSNASCEVIVIVIVIVIVSINR